MRPEGTFSLLFLGVLAFIIAGMIMPAFPHKNRPAKAAKCKSRLKQIGTTVAMYYTDEDIESTFPKDPAAFDIDPSLIKTDKITSWNEINLNSPYFFFHDENHQFTGKEDVPLATNWEPVIQGKFHYYGVVWEDGHVSHATKEERDKMINASFYGVITKFIYQVSFRNNRAVE